MEDNNEGIVITSDDVINRKKEWIEEHFDNKRPLWERPIVIDDQTIIIINYDKDFVFTEQHLLELTDIIRKARQLNPNLVKNFKKLVFDDFQPPSRYGDEEKFPINGTRLMGKDGVVLWKRGQRTDIKHRTGAISNFQGTVAHELFHFIDGDYEEAWKKEFDWHFVGEQPSEWEQIKGLTDRTFRNVHTGWVADEGQYTTHPELCSTDYAKQAWDDDFADSGVVRLFEQPKLASLCDRKDKFFTNMTTMKGVNSGAQSVTA